MAHPFYTIGHGRRTIAEFVDLLGSVQVSLLIDVRTMPRSRFNPQYNQDALPETLKPFGIGYEHIAALGGLRSKTREVDPAVNAFWDNDSFHNYADYAMSARFHAGLDHLRELGGVQRCAIMCAETVWWRCHRRIITDYLLLNGHAVDHLLGPGHIETAVPTPGARRTAAGKVVYPRDGADSASPGEQSSGSVPKSLA